MANILTITEIKKIAFLNSPFLKLYTIHEKCIILTASEQICRTAYYIFSLTFKINNNKNPSLHCAVWIQPPALTVIFDFHVKTCTIKTIVSFLYLNNLIIYFLFFLNKCLNSLILLIVLQIIKLINPIFLFFSMQHNSNTTFLVLFVYLFFLKRHGSFFILAFIVWNKKMNIY